MIRKIAAVILGISCVGLIASGVKERFAPGPRVEFAAVEAAAEEAVSRSELYGTYTFEESGNLLGNVPWRAHIELNLKRSGRYEIRVETEADDDTDVDWSDGQYRIEGKRLVLLDGSGEQNEFSRFRIEGDRLKLDADWPAVLALKVVGVGEAALRKKVEAATAETSTAAIEKN